LDFANGSLKLLCRQNGDDQNIDLDGKRIPPVTKNSTDFLISKYHPTRNITVSGSVEIALIPSRRSGMRFGGKPVVP